MKKSSLFAIAFLLCIHTITYAQSVVRQRLIDFSTFDNSISSLDRITSIFRADTNLLFAAFNNGRNSVSIRLGAGDIYYKSSMLKLDTAFNLLDTFLFSDTVTMGPLICRSLNSNQIWVASTLFRTNPSRQGFSLRKIDYEGNTVFYNIEEPNTNNLNNIPTQIMAAVPAKDGGVFVVGGGLSNRGVATEFYVMVTRFRSDGSILWRRGYDSVPTMQLVYPNSVQIDRKGHLWISGLAHQRVNAYQVDTATGRLLNARTIYTQPRNIGWSAASATPTADGGFFVAGYVSSTNLPRNDNGRVGHIAKIDSMGRVVRAINDSAGYQPIATQTFRDTTAVTCNNSIGTANNPAMAVYKRWNAQTQLISQIVFPTLPGYFQNSYTINSASYNSDGSVFYGGTVSSAFLYLCKIDRVGIPYAGGLPPFGMTDSAFNAPIPRPTSTQPQLPTSFWNTLQLYPSPSAGEMRVSHPGLLTLHNAKGQVVFSSEVVAGQQLQLSHLSSGLYLAHLRLANNTRLSCKWMKE